MVNYNKLAAGLLVFYLMLSNTAASQSVPQLINYQGRLTNLSGEPLNTTATMVFTIYDQATGGSTEWTETQNEVTVTDGLFAVLLGSVNPVTENTFQGVNRYLGIQIDGDPEITPRTQIASTAYAFNADKLDGYDAADFFTPGAPGEPSGVFRGYGSADHSTVTISESSVVMREITSILASTTQLGGGYLKIGGEIAMVFEFTNESKTETWNRGHGPGLIVQPGEVVELWAPYYQMYITIIGYEY